MPRSLQLRMRKLLTEGITAIDIAEPLRSFDDTKPVDATREIMQAHGLAVAGVRREGMVVGHIHATDLHGERLADCIHPYPESHVLDRHAYLPDVIAVLSEADHAFLSVLGSVGAVVTRWDFQKAPVRMWLFGMLTILEMYVARKLDELYPGDAWEKVLSPGRVGKAHSLAEERRRRNKSVRPVDCLQLTDRLRILLKDKAAREDAGVASIRAGERMVDQMESLRNNLAHSQDIVTENWEAIITLSDRIDRILTRV
jgi:hypothetical protein